jgi:hypothetical protein
VHSFAFVQVAPLGFCTQTLPTQLKPVTQSALVVQRVRQFVVPQT